MHTTSAGIAAPHPRPSTAPALRVLALTALLLAAALPPSSVAADSGEANPGESAAEAAPYRWLQLSPGVWAAIQPPAFHFRESNSLVVAGAAATLVVDAQGDPAKVEWLVERTRMEVEAAGGGPVRFLGLTHWHGDHTQGGERWRRAFPGITVVGHRSLWEDVPDRTEPALEGDLKRLETAITGAEEELAAGVDEHGEALGDEAATELRAAISRTRQRARRMAAIRVPLPEVAVVDRLELNLGARDGAPRVTFLHLPGHTDGDVVAWLPTERILASGDILDALPFGGHGDPARWVASLEALAELPFETLVPGHGPVLRGDAARHHLERITGWLRFITTRAARAVARVETPADALARIRETAEWRRWRVELTGWPGDAESVARFGRAFDTFAPETFTRAMAVAAGEAAEDGGGPAQPGS